jgi:hypothetical protein
MTIGIAAARKWLMRIQTLLVGFGALGFISVVGCGGGGSGPVSQPTPTPPPVVTSVVISSASTTTLISQTQQFSAQVKGTGNFSPDVTWFVNDIAGGNATIGSISTTGLYSAPPVVPASSSVTIKATSVQTPAVSGAIQGTIISGITSINVTPVNSVMPTGQKQQFQVTIGGVANQTANWSITPQLVSTSNVGTISSTGLYTSPTGLAAPVIFNITATSVIDPAAQATGSVTVFPQPSITQIDPAIADAGDTIRIFGTNLQFIRRTNFTGPNQTPIEGVAQGSDIIALAEGSDIIQVVVPLSAGTGPVFLTWQVPGFPAVSTNSLPFTRLPRLCIRSDSQDLSSGETTQIRFRVLGQPGAQAIDWSTDVGSIDASGVYQAPGNVAADSFAHIKGCISGTQSCDSQILGLHPFRIAPTQPSVALNGTLQLNAISGGSPVGATWSQLNGQGTLSSAGLYTAPNVIADAGSAVVTATFSGNTESTSIGVSGGFPGLITRVHDYIDFTGFSPFGSVDQSVAISGNRAFVAATNLPNGFVQSRFWIDVYDITDPIHPVWVDAVEAAAHGSLFVNGNFLYQVTRRDDSQGFVSTPSVIAVFDISGPTPLLVARKIVPDLLSFDFSEGIVTAVPDGIFFPVPAGTFYVFDLRGGISERDLLLQVNGQPMLVSSATVSNGRLYAVLSTQGLPPFQLGVFDLATNPPAFQGSIPLAASTIVKAAGPLLFAGSNIYDISGALPVQVGTLSGLNLRTTNGTFALSDTFQGGPRMADISDPAHPRFVGVIGQAGISLAGHNAAWAGNLLFFAEEAGGITVYDATLPGGPLEQAFLPGTGTNSFATVALDQAATATNLFVATDTNTGGVINSYDLTVNPAVRIGKFETGPATPEALNLNGSVLYVGTDSTLSIFDVSNPAAPLPKSFLPIGPVTALARSGNALYAATLDEHLLVFDVSQPGSPVQVLSLLLPEVADRMVTSGNLLLVANDIAGLGIYNIATPANPVLLSQMNIGAPVADVSVDGNLALLAAADAGLVIVNISNPASPLEVSRTPLDMPQAYGGAMQHNLAACIALKDSIAYLGTVANNDLLFAFDYRRPAHPRLISLAGYAFSISGGVGLDGALLTLHATGNSLFIGGVLELATPVIQADISQPGNAINFYFLPPALLPPPAPVATAQPANPASQEKQLKSPFQWRRRLHSRLREQFHGGNPAPQTSPNRN